MNINTHDRGWPIRAASFSISILFTPFSQWMRHFTGCQLDHSQLFPLSCVALKLCDGWFISVPLILAVELALAYTSQEEK